jgi:hypothetical protein
VRLQFRLSTRDNKQHGFAASYKIRGGGTLPCASLLASRITAAAIVLASRRLMAIVPLHEHEPSAVPKRRSVSHGTRTITITENSSGKERTDGSNT